MSRLGTFLDRLVGRLPWRADVTAHGSGRVVEPPSGSTSFHCWWEGLGASDPIVEVVATLEVLQRPQAPRLYFWALQASFADASRSYGAAHIGLQWNPRHAGSTAVNWGGYGEVSDVQSVLDGSASPLPSTPDDRNTRDYPWQEATPYRLRISRAPAGWRGEITDLSTGATSHIRDLFGGGDRLTGFVVWSEVFCACTDPQTVVRWSGFEARAMDGSVRRPASVRLTFPGGGCANTNVAATPEGIVQITNTARQARDMSVLPVPGAS
jgi:hypothetical protein